MANKPRVCRMRGGGSLACVYSCVCLVQLSRSEVFDEVTLELRVDQALVREYQDRLKDLKWTKYSPKIDTGLKA